MNVVPRQSLEGVTPPGVPYAGFIACAWTGTAVSGFVLACRLFARFKGPRRLYWDDAFAAFAFTLVLITAAVWQWGAGKIYHVLNVQAGVETYDPENFLPWMRQWLLASLIAELFFYTSLVSIKLAFLFFFRRLGASIQYFRWIWWPVLGITLGSYFGAVGNVHYKCLVGPIETVLQECNTAPSVSFIIKTLKANCALDVLTDFMSMYPQDTFRKSFYDSMIRWAKKFAILGLFSLSIITMVIAIVRVADIGSTRRPDGNIDNSYLWLWSFIEPCVAIVVSCLSAFPQLFKPSVTKKPVFTPSESFLRRMSRIRAKRNRPQGRDMADLGSMSQSTVLDNSRIGPEHITRRSQDSRQPVLVPNGHDPVVYACKGTPRIGSQDEDQITHQIEVTVTNQSWPTRG
ncbi:hypothetical protein PG991_001028 [Apiospora marii]|uniref:Rhodopsin domain-containing protein n=1 Tax=Apiospora marii TaxID=335849 RepID=A0ABR1STN1_9PEZI